MMYLNICEWQLNIFYIFPRANRVCLFVCLESVLFQDRLDCVQMSRGLQSYTQSLELDVIKWVEGDFNDICSSEIECHRSLARPQVFFS